VRRWTHNTVFLIKVALAGLTMNLVRPADGAPPAPDVTPNASP
jgi:hypothetical protein